MLKPVVLLIKSLHGHPEAGAHWENHLHEILKAMTGKVSPGFPGNYIFKDTGLLLCVYVDDFTLAGPEEKHAAFWEALTKVVDLDPPRSTRSCAWEAPRHRGPAVPLR